MRALKFWPLLLIAVTVGSIVESGVVIHQRNQLHEKWIELANIAYSNGYYIGRNRGLMVGDWNMSTDSLLKAQFIDDSTTFVMILSQLEQ